MVKRRLKITGLDPQERVNGRWVGLRGLGQDGRPCVVNQRGRITVGGQVIIPDGLRRHPGDALQDGGGPAGTVLAAGTMVHVRKGVIGQGEQDRAEGCSLHRMIGNECPVHSLHGVDGRRGGSGERRVRHRTRGAIDIDVGVSDPLRHSIGLSADLGGRAQVYIPADAQGGDGRRVRAAKIT